MVVFLALVYQGREGNRGQGAEQKTWEGGGGQAGTRQRWPKLTTHLLLGEIAFFGGMTIVYKSSIDLFLYVVGSSHENEVS